MEWVDKRTKNIFLFALHKKLLQSSPVVILVYTKSTE